MRYVIADVRLGSSLKIQPHPPLGTAPSTGFFIALSSSTASRPILKRRLCRRIFVSRFPTLAMARFVVSYWEMKKVAANPTPKAGKNSGRNALRRGSFEVVTVVRGRDTTIVRRGKIVGGEVSAPESMRYDAEDIEEANRIGAALCRQHAR